jgi:hypothetical protein
MKQIFITQGTKNFSVPLRYADQIDSLSLSLSFSESREALWIDLCVIAE